MKIHIREIDHVVIRVADPETVARFYCDAKVLEIGEGTNEIQHLVIARALGC